MRRSRTTKHENVIYIVSRPKSFIFSQGWVIFIAENFTGLSFGLV
jgi:hypothetical protein